MDRRHFLQTAALGAAALAISPTASLAAGGDKKRKGKPTLKISFQEAVAPGKSLEEKLDRMEQLGVVGLEPGGGNLGGRINEFQQALRGRDIKITAICAGFEGFILAEDPAVKKKFDDSYKEILAAAGELGSVGVIMVPAFNSQVPVRPHTLETRAWLVEQLHELGEYALACNTSVILEPLNRSEAYFLRQVADAASMCRDAQSDGVRCMGDFWHMTAEETSDYGAFFSGDKYLNHVHIASRGNRLMPGEDGAADDYRNGFEALQLMEYQGYVSLECGTRGDRDATAAAAVQLMNQQWKEA